ncbi:MAG: hypothetical protein HY445_00940 [Candidatus Niyogibacteria bacterium]|nr:hypothetical protein [Candidatus Niyogibacteria bacterium]
MPKEEYNKSPERLEEKSDSKKFSRLQSIISGYFEEGEEENLEKLNVYTLYQIAEKINHDLDTITLMQAAVIRWQKEARNEGSEKVAEWLEEKKMSLQNEIIAISEKVSEVSQMINKKEDEK